MVTSAQNTAILPHFICVSSRESETPIRSMLTRQVRQFSRVALRLLRPNIMRYSILIADYMRD